MLNFADAAASNIHPFIGLRPYRVEDAAFFFGRELQIATLLHLIRNGSLVSVIGSSGSGKSSLVRAGLLPALKSAETGEPPWEWVEMRPGEAPVRNLAEALARPNEGAGAAPSDSLAEPRADRIEIMLRSSSFGIGEALRSTRVRDQTRLLIVVDQFEEIFRYANLRARRNTNPTRASELRDEATFFVQLLLTAAADEQFSGAIVLTMRSDFIGDCARFYGLSEAVTRTQYLVPALTRDQRALAIRGPVERAGATIEPALVQRVLNDTNEDPDQLPVLQHAMMRCCQRAQDHDRPLPPAFTLERYNEIGGIERALTQHGDEVLAALAQPDAAPGGLNLQDIAKRIFQSLTEVESQGRVIRRPQTIGDLVKVIARDDAPADEVAEIEAAVHKVVAHFADPMCSFLRAPTEDTLSANAVVDIGHEALIRRWERLGGNDPTSWVRLEREDAEKYNRLVTLADLDALPPQLLQEFETWWQQRQPSSFWASRYTRGGESRLKAAADLLARSRAEVARKRAEATQRRRRRRVTVVGGAVVVGAIAMLAAWLPFYNAQKARENAARIQEAQIANVAKMRALQIAAAGLNLLKRDSADQAGLLAKYALSHEDARKLENRLPFEPENMALAYEALQHMQERVVLTAQKGTIGVVFKPVSGSQKLELVTVSWADRGDPWVWDVSPVWSDIFSRPTKLHEMKSANQLSAYQLSVNKTGDAMLSGPTVDSEGISLVTSGSKGWIRNDAIRVDGKRPIFGVFAPDRDLTLTGGAGTKWAMWMLSRPVDGGPITWPANPSHVFADIAPASGFSGAAAISASGKFVAIAANDGTVQVYKGLGNGHDWSPARELCHSSGDQNTCNSGHRGQDPTLPKNPVKWLMFDPSNPDRLIGAYEQGGSIDVWSIASGSVTTLETYNNLPIFRGAISPDGQFVAATIQNQPRICLWKMPSPESRQGSGESPLLLQGSPDDGSFISVAFDNQNHIAAGTTNGKVSLWYTQPALSRGLDPLAQSVPAGMACASAGPAGTKVTRAAKNGDWVVTSKVRGVAKGNLTIPVGAGGIRPGIDACKVSGDGKWLLLAPSQGRLMLYDLRYLSSPVGVFGEAGAKWSGADFAEKPDRIVARSIDGAVLQWQFFRDKDKLLAFVDQSLPRVSNENRFKPAELSATTDYLLNGNFWSLMRASESDAPPIEAHASDDKSYSALKP
ncbi:hypothetical protein SBC1_76060 (plasmid) [Caballeronia sp. SBC1]|uniref:WD40 repeat domain-containing protein n=1 Tax=unclassified Caballeronia TaxID=2646786 RepID=UPI0013E1A220|nr:MULTISPECIES: WD40 repeat domain-containing protein [unclassified Caballeronia]QIE29848.1 hypothetical protein SBC2_79240 [Caballeronia sp. SBC2]QIN67559.1 hypothetical protein SBC1_76060 [Caballeronia sp. SBC1]